MKMVILIVDAEHIDSIKSMLKECDVPGYSEIPNVLGMGTTGIKLGNRAFPGSSTMLLIALEEHCVDMLTGKLQQFREENGSSEGLKAFSFDTKEMI